MNDTLVNRIGLIANIVTALAALVAVVVIPLQISAADRIQNAQTAREIYREYLNLTIQKPELATADWCVLKSPRDQAAYVGYVDYLLYTAEQAIDADPDWAPVMRDHLSAHLPYLCSESDDSQESRAVAELLSEMRAQCATIRVCAGG
ncbi:hypothetical protein [Pseudoprimorskyibacter insulae]|uniref:Uncharacterized protein n=1 Tax=Pseudoprimorskyibacter insulae TaxID=1695997 RepID=A0A2R8AW60_9RHOB|nr:hypothetical protein [Pseudoprimorskyibacter insulae]SPF80282.1 hypothetical protein PRI8871_02086 [Pseudoprimorskyibacter insulae]